MTNVSNDVVFVTGATSGMGAAITRRFIDEGARVVATGRRTDRLDALRNELGDRLHTATLDVRDRDAVGQCVAALPPDFAEISVLVNNAGLSLGGGKFHEDDLDDMLTMIDTNIKGVVHVTHAILPGMVRRDRGHVFNIGSVGGVYTTPGNSIYGSTKSFLHLFTLDLRAELLGHHIRVTVLEPGAVDTEFFEVRARGDKSALENFKRGFRIIAAEEFADILFYAYALPPHVNANIIEIMPTDQNWNRVAIHRTT